MYTILFRSPSRTALLIKKCVLIFFFHLRHFFSYFFSEISDRENKKLEFWADRFRRPTDMDMEDVPFFKSSPGEWFERVTSENCISPPTQHRVSFITVTVNWKKDINILAPM